MAASEAPQDAAACAAREAVLLAFKRVTAGRCFRCLASDHLASVCRDPVRCFWCRRFGHRERACRAARKQPPPPPQRSKRTSLTTASMAIGDPHTQLEVETVFVSSSFHLEHDARDWEACALVPWALHLPPDAGARDITNLITRELRLQPGDVTVTLHQPEPYLVRFEHAAHAAEACRRGRFIGGGIDICLRTWVRLCLDGIPSHAWTPEIIERVVGHKCALQHIVTNLIQPADSRHIDLWAWTVDPSEIPKKRLRPSWAWV
uniref:CCHC-type domain-containing protein n=1 Tax=Setaria viridis TaxID=4556 RepID=A0A4U6U6A7_SETVI|nr:hypothetical protein SEVIR_7G197400v2 [Setaria viridis]